MDTMIWVYLGYLIICVLITTLVARTLRMHGPVFISGKSDSPTPITRAKTHLLIVGFYLMCIGLISYTLSYGQQATDAKSGIELMSSKVGGMILFIGLMHFLMVWVFAAIRNNDRIATSPSVAPNREPIVID